MVRPRQACLLQLVGRHEVPSAVLLAQALDAQQCELIKMWRLFFRKIRISMKKHGTCRDSRTKKHWKWRLPDVNWYSWARLKPRAKGSCVLWFAVSTTTNA